MVFPSRGCQTCRHRRIKCDGIRQICDRCRKACRTCTWDSNDQAGLHFKSENVFAQGQPRRPRRPKELSADPMALTSQQPRRVPAAMSPPIGHLAFQYWVKNFMFAHGDLPDIGHEYGVFVLSNLSRASSGSSLHLALSALSCAVFGRARRVNKAIEFADRIYPQIITKTSKEMTKLSSDGIDQLLLTTILMGAFENITYKKPTSSSENQCSSPADEVGTRLWEPVCHHDGAIGLLKLRKHKGLAPNLALDKLVRRQIIRTCILRGVVVPDGLDDGADFGEEGPGLQFDALMVRSATLRAKSLSLFIEKNSEPPISVENHWQDLASQAHELDTALALWSEAVPEDWKFSSHLPPVNLNLSETDLLYNGPIHSYTTHGHASIWNRYRAVRLISNSIRFRSLSNFLQYQSQRSLILSQQYICQQNIKQLANDLCGSIPFFFNPSSAMGEEVTVLTHVGMENHVSSGESEILPKFAGLIAWPLTVAVSTEGIPGPQRQWLKLKLAIVGNSLADRVLTSIVEQGEFRF